MNRSTQPRTASMMKKLFAIVLVFAAVVMLTGLASAKTSVCPLGFGMQSYELRSKINPDTYWKADYPVFERSKAGKIINRAILKALVSRTPSPEEQPSAKSIEQAAAAFIDEAEQLQRGEKEHVWSWESETRAQVLLDQPGIVTVSIFTYAFTGGAHGMSVTSYLVFDTTTGKQLGLNDLFVPGFGKKLDRLIENRFRQMRGLSPNDPLNGEKGGLFENKIAHNDNVALTGNGIRFLYNQYDIAPYSAGQIEIDLPFSQLRDLLKPLEALKPLTHEGNTTSSK